MQKDISTSYIKFNDLASLYSPLLDESDGYDTYSSLYPSIFAPTPSDMINLPRYYSHTPNTDVYTHPFQYLFNEQQEDLLEQQNWSLSRLRETANEAEALRQENINLQIAIIELNKHVKSLLMLQSSSQKQNSRVPLAALPSPSLFDSLRKMHISEKQQARVDEEKEDRENLDVNRVSLPKSISVRSNGYLKTVQAGGSSIRGGGRVRAENQSKPVKAAQRVYVRGEEKEEKLLELQVFNQGMSKTELCNKWQQTGACPYGDNCHFAHGIEELRPVLRHPRYKTEVCCMVLSGDPCPYGHRCHFRHSLTDQERLIAQQAKLRSLWQK